MARMQLLCAGALALLAPACSETQSAIDLSTLDRPSSIAFTCFGQMRVADSGEVITTAQPFGNCQVPYEDHDGNPNTPEQASQPLEGQEELNPPVLVGFVAQQASGTVAVMVGSVTNIDTPGIGGAGIIDTDRLTPGENAIPVGTLPVGVVTDPSGCHAITANAGSCDLSLLDVNALLDLGQQPQVQRLAIVDGAGGRVGARPRAIVGDPVAGPVGVECAPVPDSVVYVALPDCNAVAAVNAGTGQTLAGIALRDDGAVELVPDVGECNATCGAVVGPATAAGRPIALHMQADGQRLYVGSENRAEIVVVDLDADRLPVAASVIPLEGEVGITALAATDVIGMGGSGGDIVSGGGGNHRFVYAIATDGTVRVADVLNKNIECDTQVDPRFLYDSTNVGLLSCIPIDPVLHPRRLGARSPGIHLKGPGVPLDLAFATVDSDLGTEPAPDDLVGTFAFVTLSSGRVVVVNVDDDGAADFESASNPAATDVTLAIAHQPRDNVGARDTLPGEAEAGQSGACQFPSSDPNQLGPRVSSLLGQSLVGGAVADAKNRLLPFGRSVVCEERDDQNQASLFAVPELSFMAPLALRELAFPDLLSASNGETWTFTWEGAISNNGAVTATRRGEVSTAGGLQLRDGGRPFCSMGVEPFDTVTLIGCDPTASQCALGETCFVHPDTPASITTGLCLPSDEAQLLAEPCRELLVSRRRFTVRETFSDRLALGERRRALRTTPLDGCVSDEQCVALYDEERALASPDDPVELELEPSAFSWSCEPDPTRAPGPDRCVMTCAATADCEQGFQCSGGYCVEAKAPPARCLDALQRYEVRVSDAFAVAGSQTGFLHARTADPATGECVTDPAAHPLAVGRLPLQAPACLSDDRTDLAPNPCSTTVEHARFVVTRNANGTCPADPAPASNLAFEVEPTPAIRFKNPAFTFHLVNPVTSGDLECNGDGQGAREPFPAVFPDYRLSFSLIGGFSQLSAGLIRGGMRHPVRIVPGPLGGLWIADEGDISGSTRGLVLRIQPARAREGFAVATVR